MDRTETREARQADLDSAVEKARDALANLAKLRAAIAKTEAERPEIAAIEHAVVEARADALLGDDAPADLEALTEKAARARHEARIAEQVITDLRRRVVTCGVGLRQAEAALDLAWRQALTAECGLLFAATVSALAPIRTRFAEVTKAVPGAYDGQAYYIIGKTLKTLDEAIGFFTTSVPMPEVTNPLTVERVEEANRLHNALRSEREQLARDERQGE